LTSSRARASTTASCSSTGRECHAESAIVGGVCGDCCQRKTPLDRSVINQQPVGTRIPGSAYSSGTLPPTFLRGHRVPPLSEIRTDTNKSKFRVSLVMRPRRPKNGGFCESICAPGHCMCLAFTTETATWEQPVASHPSSTYPFAQINCLFYTNKQFKCLIYGVFRSSDPSSDRHGIQVTLPFLGLAST
jgi:hypothetical protein